MNTTYKLYDIGVFPTLGQYENVVARVRWGIDFEEQGCVSRHGAETLLRVDQIENFIPIEQLTRAQILDWCVATQGGQTYMNQLTEYHGNQLAYKVAQLGIQPYTGINVDPLPTA